MFPEATGSRELIPERSATLGSAQIWLPIKHTSRCPSPSADPSIFEVEGSIREYYLVAQSLGGESPAKRSAIHWTTASALSRPTDRCPTPGRIIIRTLLPALQRLDM